jgi:hypothetical protein
MCEGIAWENVWRGNSPPRVIIYSRRNVVKSVISDYRGRQMKALCGESNLSRGAQAMQCQRKMPSKLNVSVPDFMRSVYHWQVLVVLYVCNIIMKYILPMILFVCIIHW